MSSFNQKDPQGPGCGCLVVLIYIVLFFFQDCQWIKDTKDFDLPEWFIKNIFWPTTYAIIYSAILWSVLLTLLHFISSLIYHIPNRPRKKKLQEYYSSQHPAYSKDVTDSIKREPAIENYFYWKGDWIINSWSLCKENILSNYRCMANYCSRIGTAWSNSFTNTIGEFNFWGGLWGVATYAGPLTLYQLCRILILLLGLILILPPILIATLLTGIFFFLLSNTLAIIIFLFEKITTAIKGVFIICPACSQKISKIKYVCPSCGVHHSKLAPSPRYGIFTHTCVCGKKLPTSRFWGRTKLTSICPACSATLTSGSENVIPCTVAFIGGSCSGKSYLEAAILHELTEHAKSYKCKGELSRNTKSAKDLIAARKNNYRPLQGSLKVFGVDLTKFLALTARRVFLYAPEGSDFTNTRTITTHHYYKNLVCTVFVIDPFSIYDVIHRLKHQNFDFQSVRAGTDSADDIFSRWLITMENEAYSNVIRKSRCAVVLTKMDHPAIYKISGLHPGADSDAIRQFLENFGLASLIPQLAEFKETRFFSVTGLYNESGREHSGIIPLTGWILNKSIF